ncbi:MULTISPECIES: MMPL family transporter [unclassified Streptomyces]|uniref:MMPL family transporter n=1 Tax=unclassified Streptomyces TaxID=2593676 RepID=UPI0003637BFC|nr:MULTISPECIES: MMPL family transporter [unclassified Streptomyces]MYT30498.1 MMPL family transporter [Streptomyces sp. SID8354]
MRQLPPTAPAAAAAERMRAAFAAPPDRLLTVVVTGPQAAAGADAYAGRLEDLADVTAVRVVRTLPAQQAAVLLAVSPSAPGTRASHDVVRAVRNTPAPGTVVVGGRAAEVADTVAGALPWCLTALGVRLALLLGAFTHSVIAPLKALTVAAVSLGGLVLIFQEGHGRALLGGFTVTHTLDPSPLLFVLIITLALSVDYEVFLLGRIREEYVRCRDNRTTIVDGIGRTGRLMTSAPPAVAVSTAAMGTSDVALLKLIGIGIGVALGGAVDAVLVRGVLVPAVMTQADRTPGKDAEGNRWGNRRKTPPPRPHTATHNRRKAPRPLRGSGRSGRRSRRTATPSTRSWPRWRAPRS